MLYKSLIRTTYRCLARFLQLNRRLVNPAFRILALAAAVPAFALIILARPAAGAGSPWPVAETISWVPGTEHISFENLEGMMLVTATARGANGHDTTGLFVFDTGAGYLALDADLAIRIGIADSASARDAVDLAERPLPRITLGDWALDQVEPVLTIVTDPVRQATDRPVLGLMGQKPLQDRAIWIDYRLGRMALIPAGSDVSDSADPPASARLLRGVLSQRATPVPFRLVGDGKVIVRARITGPQRFGRTAWLTLIVDTGSSKCVLFESALDSFVEVRDWPALRGLVAPTLIGTGDARLVRARAIELQGAKVSSTPGVDVAILRSRLGEVLERSTGEPIHGLLGYSFLKRFRVVLDYPHRVLWLDPIPGYRDDRPFEHSHVGIQLERRGGLPQVVAVAEGSPAAQAGIEPGDAIVAVNGALAQATDVVTIARLMEGRPGSSVTLTLRRGDLERIYRLRRRRFL